MTTALATPESDIVSMLDLTHLSVTQRDALLTALVQLRLAEMSVPNPVTIRDGEQIIARLVPVLRPPTKTTMPDLPAGFKEAIQHDLDHLDEEPLLTTEEVRVLLARDFAAKRAAQ